ncbi:MAG: ORF6N domain-containing protein [Bacteroidales bacterium]|nr:ORF6N domain-containing protein [Bacteroidales bacterium]
MKNNTLTTEVVAKCNNLIKEPGILIPVTDIEKMIFTIRGVQVMFDRNLAQLYGVTTSRINQQVNRNIARFPESFRFQLTAEERDEVVAKCNNLQSLKYNPKLPFVFTEQGVAQLSSVLHSPVAIEASVKIMNAFVSMRRFMVTNAMVFQRLDAIEHHQLVADQRIDEIFKRIDSGLQPAQGIFFDGQIFDAYQFIGDLIRSAKKEIVLFDNYVDDTVLTMLDKRRKKVSATICTRAVSNQLKLDMEKHNAQYQPIKIITFDKVHDRFLCIDNTVYHIGASLKDLGKKWFAFSKMEITTEELSYKIKQ